MRKIIEYLLANFLWFILWFRYNVKVVGLEKLNKSTLPKSGGVLFLPNHPCVFNDPIIAALSIFPKYRIRPMIIDYMYNAPVINLVARFLRALPIPNFYVSSNSLKRKRSDRVIEEIIQQLGKGENFMIAPAGKVKRSPLESIGGNSAVHRILQEAPEANVVLIRTKGLYGSSFSTYLTGTTPPIAPLILWGIKQCFKNLLFFTPRREVIVELEPAPADFPFDGSRIELNRYLENWYNRPDGLSPQQGPSPGDSLVLVSYSMWGNKFLSQERHQEVCEENISLSLIPVETKDKIIEKIATLADRPVESIHPNMNLSTDLGMDSLDTAEMSVFLQEHFDLEGVPVNQLTTVARVMALAARQITYKDQADAPIVVPERWHKKDEAAPELPPGTTIPEVFLRNCERCGKSIACADEASGMVSYDQLKLRVILLADYIQKLPGQYIGILLPASVAANAVILAVQLAGKIPVPVNWTVGSRHLESVLQLSKLTSVLTSMAFLDRLENVDLDLVEPYLIMLEDVRKGFTWRDKLKAFYRSKCGVETVLKAFGCDKLTGDDKGVLLFTSGTENMPKGVPLTYTNLLTNLRGAIDVVQPQASDVLFGILPPFHSFGFTVSGICALLAGVRVAYSPNPTDGKKLADGFEKWDITLLVGPPTFVKGLVKAAKPGQLKKMRLCVTGAEKAPPELFKLINDIGGELLEGYGITECSPVLTMNPIVGKHKGVGVAFPGVEITIVHPDTKEPLPRNTQGLILARGASVFSGYLNADVASPFVLHEGKQWYKTGDLGVLDDDGYLTIAGRLKRFIKIGGEMVSLIAIEDALLRASMKKGWPTLQDGPALAVCAKELPGEKTKIYLFSRFEASLDEINLSLRESGFSNLLRISTIKHVPEIPIMGSGKVNYRALETEYLN